MKVNILIIACEKELNSEINKILSGNAYNCITINNIKHIEKYSDDFCLGILYTSHFVKYSGEETALPDIPYLLLIDDKKYITKSNNYLIDCLSLNFSEEEILFRISNLLNFQEYYFKISEQHDKLRLSFDKNRRKTIDLFGKHIDLKKAQKEIQEKNNKLEKAIEKNKQKTIDLFGKHIDLKKAKKEIFIQKEEIEKQKHKLELFFEKKKRKTIDLFGKHIDLKKAQKEISAKNELLQKVLDKNKQKTLDLFGKHIDLKKAQKEIKAQKSQIEKQNDSITDSIKYAGFIQEAVLPKEEVFNELLPKHMLLFMPRDIVSGDFYWIDEINNKIYISAADCTGHGVPGAFMSMMGMSLLNEVVMRYKSKKASDLLELLRDKVVYSLHQTGKMDEAADGMDLSFCIIDRETLNMEFAGAHNPVYILRNDELMEIKGDRMPIGFSLRLNKPFTNNEVQLQKGDRLYMFSDGYADQFGGENGMKMRYKVFQQHLLNCYKLDFDQQKQYLLEEFNKWKGDYNQIDDILVLGFEV